MFPLDPLFNEMPPDIYATYVSGILGRGGAGEGQGEQGCRRQRRQHTTETLNIMWQIPFRNIPRHQLYKYIKSLVVGVVVLYRCFTLVWY